MLQLDGSVPKPLYRRIYRLIRWMSISDVFKDLIAAWERAHPESAAGEGTESL
jgi:hypothetical protein